MSKIADAEANSTSLDGLVNDNGLIPTLRNGPKPSYQYLVDGWNAEIAEAILEMNKSRGFRVVGAFADGFTYELFNDVGIDVDGNSWIYVGTGVPNKVVTAGTVPGAPDYEQVTFNSLAASSVFYAVKEASMVSPPSVQDVADWYSVYVEEFRGDGFSDSETIQAALNYINNLPYTGVNLTFEQGRTYVYDKNHSIKNINNLHINLNGATLKRVDGNTTSSLLAQEVTVATDKDITLDSIPSNWGVGTWVTTFTSDSDADTNRDPRKIVAINGNTITLNAAFFFNPAKTTLPVGTRVASVFKAFEGRPSKNYGGADLLEGINERIFISNGTIDGNSGNQYNYSWVFCNEILLHSKGGVIERVNFKNTAGECFVGHGTTIRTCVFEDINGSMYHTSVNDATLADSGFAWFVGNTCKRIGLATQAKNGHSEGALTFSWGAGNFIIKGNILEDLTNDFLGSFSPSDVANADKFLLVSGNIVKKAKGIFYAINEPAMGVHITDNIFHDCGNNNAKTLALSQLPNCTFSNNTKSGNTLFVEHSYVNRQYVNSNGDAKTQYRGVLLPSYIVKNYIGDFTPTIASTVLTITENNGSNMHGMISDGVSGIVHLTKEGTHSGSAYYQYDPGNKTTSIGTNIAGGKVKIKTDAFKDKLIVSSAGVETPNFAGFYIGTEDTDQSWRFTKSGSNLLLQRRENGVWVTKHTFTA